MSYAPDSAGTVGSGAQYSRGWVISSVAVLVPTGYCMTLPPVERLPVPSVSQPSAGQVLPVGPRVTSEPTSLWPTRLYSVGMPDWVTSLHCKPSMPRTTTCPLGALPASCTAAEAVPAAPAANHTAASTATGGRRRRG